MMNGKMNAKRQKRLVFGCVTLLGASCAVAADWPQWRGPDRDGKVSGFTEPKAWPQQLTKGWKTSIGSGDATPALVGDKLYAFAREGTDEVTVCLDAGTGKEIWRDKYPAGTNVSGPASGHPGPRRLAGGGRRESGHHGHRRDRLLPGCRKRKGHLAEGSVQGFLLGSTHVQGGGFPADRGQNVHRPARRARQRGRPGAGPGDREYQVEMGRGWHDLFFAGRHDRRRCERDRPGDGKIGGGLSAADGKLLWQTAFGGGGGMRGGGGRGRGGPGGAGGGPPGGGPAGLGGGPPPAQARDREVPAGQAQVRAEADPAPVECAAVAGVAVAAA